MKHVLNTLYVNQDRAYLHKEGSAIIVRLDKKKIAQFPIVAVGEIVCFGFGVGVSPQLAEFCASEGTTVTYLNGFGRFLARMEGPVRGNVLLRRKQYHDSDTPARALEIAKACTAAKIINQRSVLLRYLRNHQEVAESTTLERAGISIRNTHRKIRSAPTVETLRGLEGDAAATYFSVFDQMLRADSSHLRFRTRTRRPPRDPINAMLSFGYSLLANDLRSALESVGLDPFVGFLHVERPGRPSLALDIMEEFRAPLVDRLVLSLVNRKEVGEKDFGEEPSGAVQMTPTARKTFLTAYQKRKRDVLVHPLLDEKLELGIIFLTQARLLARHIRGDLEIYPAFIWR